MAGTLNVGANKIFIFEQSVSEIATYTIDSASIFPTGFELLSISVQTITTGGAGTMTIHKDATNVLHGANTATTALGVLTPELSRTSANLNFTGAEDLIIVTAGNVSSNRVVIEVCEYAPRSVTVS